MASRRKLPEDWRPSSHEISIRSTTTTAKEAGGDLPKSSTNTRALRLKPINIPGKDPQSVLEVAQALRKPSVDSSQSPRDPEVIDVAPQQEQWTRQNSPVSPLMHRLEATRSNSSQDTSRQSQISLGILDYYLRNPTPSPSPLSPDLPPLPTTPRLNPAAIEAFDFGLQGTKSRPPVRPGLSRANQRVDEIMTAKPEPSSSVTTAQPSPPAPESPNERPRTRGRSYSIFPALQEAPPPSPITATATAAAARPSRSFSTATRQSRTFSNESVPTTSTTTTPITPSFPLPSPSALPVHRPRKISLTSSVRTRNDSITSYRHHKTPRNVIPLRIWSSDDSTQSSVRTTVSVSSISSPPFASNPGARGVDLSRWSDETSLTSPSFAPTPGPMRTSFGSLLRRNEDSTSFDRQRYHSQTYSHSQPLPSPNPHPYQTYPACFFEADDEDGEDVPLRKKWGDSWRGSGKDSSSSSAVGGGAGGNTGRVGSRASGRSKREERWSKGCYDDDDDRGGGGGMGWRWVFCGCAGRK